MKSKFAFALAALASLLPPRLALAAETGNAKTDLAALVEKIRVKFASGPKTEEDLAPELQEFDTLFAAHKDEKTDDTAQILYSEAKLYSQMLNDADKAAPLLQKLKDDFPATGPGRLAAVMLPTVQKQSVALKTDAKTQLAALVQKVDAKLAAGHDSAADLADNLKEFDTLLASHQGEKTDDVAQILFSKGTLYFEVLKDGDRSKAIMDQVKADFPGTPTAKQADNVIAAIGRQAAATKIQNELAIGTLFPDFAEKDTNGQPLSVANYRGKVVMIDFWAMWCGPCLAELPNVVKTYQQYHDKGFEIIGVSLDRQGDDTKLAQFTKDKTMPWAQYFDGQYWSNKLAVKYGINAIPATYLIDGQGRIIGKNLRGDALAAAVAKAVGAK